MQDSSAINRDTEDVQQDERYSMQSSSELVSISLSFYMKSKLIKFKLSSISSLYFSFYRY